MGQSNLNQNMPAGSQKQIDPVMMAVTNLFIAGYAYLRMHLYKRLFILEAAFFVNIVASVLFPLYGISYS